MLLKFKKLHFIIEAPVDVERYDSENNIVLNTFMKTLVETYVSDIITMKSGFEVWTCLGDRILRSKQQQLLQSLLGLTHLQFRNLDQYI